VDVPPTYTPIPAAPELVAPTVRATAPQPGLLNLDEMPPPAKSAHVQYMNLR
jgi:hypothetical protein